MKLLSRACIIFLCGFHALAQEPVRVEVVAAERTREAMAETVRLVALIQGGTLRGFQAFGIRPGSLFDRIGLKQQDLIVAVNGQASTPADIYAAMESATVVELLVQSPAGTQRTLVFELVEK